MTDLNASAQAQQDDPAETAVAEDVEAEEIRMNNVEVSGLTIDLSEFDDTDEAIKESFSSALGGNVEGFEAESVEVGDISSADISIEDNVATIDAEVEFIALEDVEADQVSFDGAATQSGAVEEMLTSGSLSAENTTVSELSVETLTLERGDAPTETPNETEEPETETETEEPETEEPETETETEEPETETETEEPETETETEEPETETETEEPETETETEEPETETEEETQTPNETEDAATTSVNFTNQTTDGTSVVVDSVEVSEGGFVVIHNDTLLDGDAVGSVIGVSEYLEPGSYENVTVTLFNVEGTDVTESDLTETLIAMPHEDTNENESYDFVTSLGEADGPYTEDGEAVTDAATVTLEEEATETVDETETEEAT